MKNSKYSYIIYFISIVIAITLGIQIYWNYKNYEEGKAQLIRDVQLSLDLAVDKYYEDVAKRNTVGFISSGGNSTKEFFESSRFKDLLKSRVDSSTFNINSIRVQEDVDSLGYLTIEGATSTKIDSIFKSRKTNSNSITSEKPSRFVQDFFNKQRVRNKSRIGNDTIHSTDSTTLDRQDALKALSTKIVFSINEDTVDIKKLDTLVVEQLRSINIDRSEHSLSYSPKGDTTQVEMPKSLNVPSPKYDLYVYSNSDLLPEESILWVGFNDVTSLVLKKNLVGILLSVILMVAVIASLLYLLKIIQEQKQLAEIKNDFISNITHEFKTPIATISAAVEGIRTFNEQNDPVKTEKYLNMSSEQLSKLNMMVERILDTATLDKEDLALQKAPADISQMLSNLVIKYKSVYPDLPIDVSIPKEPLVTEVDIFHIENAIDNLIDNAYKYGKPPISISSAVNSKTGHIEIKVKDAGKALTREQAAQLFEKFYRVPKGNTHDVKGFGIGLYYTKTIIEKHGGTVKLNPSPQTTFLITLPYV